MPRRAVSEAWVWVRIPVRSIRSNSAINLSINAFDSSDGMYWYEWISPSMPMNTQPTSDESAQPSTVFCTRPDMSPTPETRCSSLSG